MVSHQNTSEVKLLVSAKLLFSSDSADKHQSGKSSKHVRLKTQNLEQERKKVSSQVLRYEFEHNFTATYMQRLDFLYHTCRCVQVFSVNSTSRFANHLESTVFAKTT